MKPSAHVVGPPARAALGGRVDAAEARRLRDELERAEEPLRALGAVEREADERPGEAHLARRERVLRMVLEPRMADVEHVRPLAQEARERERVRALALEPQRERRRASGAAATPRTARRSRRPASGARAAPPPTRGRARATPPRTRSEWPESAFVALYMTASAPRSSGRCPSGVASVLSTASRAPGGMGGIRDRGDVADVERRDSTASRSTRASRRAQAATIASVSVGTKRTSTPRGASRSVATPRTPG